MNMDFTETQQMLKAGARDFFEKEFPQRLVREREDDPNGYDPLLWKKMPLWDGPAGDRGTTVALYGPVPRI